MRTVMKMCAIVIVCACLLSSCSLLGANVKIKEGFSDELVAMLHEQYDFNIPESAVFINGYYETTGQDNAICIAFTLPYAELENMLGTQWQQVDKSTLGVNSFESLDVNTEPYIAYNFSGEMFTWLQVSYCDYKGVVTCAFNGRRPNIEHYGIK